jgi:site-specific DNA-methyltransferase (adenine-specific)
MLLGAFDTEREANNFKAYMMCKLPRFLLRLTYSSMNIAKSNFMFVPKVDFQNKWDDKSLYQKFKLTDDEIALVEATIRPMDGGDD